jgi:UDP-glucose 4-epimerase
MSPRLRTAMMPLAVHFESSIWGRPRGTSVLQLVRCFEQTNGLSVPVEIVGRRAGDAASIFADSSLANSELCWRATRTIADMCRDAWRFMQSGRRYFFFSEDVIN